MAKKLKQYVRAKEDVVYAERTELIAHTFYELISLVESEHYSSGTCAIVVNENKHVIGYDIELFYD